MNTAPEAWVQTLSTTERASWNEIIEAGYSEEQAYDAIIRAREEMAELVAASPKVGAPGRRKRRAADKRARASRRRNRR